MLIITNGGKVVDDGYIGYLSANNAVIVAGGGAVWSNNASLYVGCEESGNSLTIGSGGAVAVGNNLTIGNSVGSTGSVWLTGGTLTTLGSTIVGNYGAGSLVVSSGTWVANDVYVALQAVRPEP